MAPEPRIDALPAQRRTVMVATNITPPDQLAARVKDRGLANVGELAHGVETPYGPRSGSAGRSCVLHKWKMATPLADSKRSPAVSRARFLIRLRHHGTRWLSLQ
ncbi:MAG: hypothetical protein OXJ37_23150 [Bryobacterales bacterium]|nr:hypothetical protein [Bryobacterales bacterium]